MTNIQSSVEFMVYNEGYIIHCIYDVNTLYLHAEKLKYQASLENTKENKGRKKMIKFFINYLKTTNYKNKSLGFNHKPLYMQKPRKPMYFKLFYRGYDSSRKHPVDLTYFKYKDRMYTLTIQDFQLMIQESWEYPYITVPKKKVKNTEMDNLIRLLCDAENSLKVHITGLKVGNFIYPAL